MEKMTFKNFLLYLSGVTCFCLALFKTYNGNHHGFYLLAFKFFSNEQNFIHDIYLNNSTVINSSMFFRVYQNLFYNINFDNDFVGITVHFFLTLCSVFYLFKILNEFIFKDKYISLIVLCGIALTDSFFLNAIRSSIFFSHSLTPSHFCNALIFPLLYSSLKQNYSILTLISTLMILLSLKLSWMPISICYSFLLINKFYNLKNESISKVLISTVVPFSVLLIMVLNNTTVNPTETDFIWDVIVNRNQEEDVFHLNDWKRIFITLISFFILYLLIKKYKTINPHFRSLSFVVLILSVLNFVFGFFYLYVGQEYFAKPQIILLSFPRALKLFQLFFFIYFLKYILDNKDKLFFISSFLIVMLIYFLSFGIISYSLFAFNLTLLLVFLFKNKTVIDSKSHLILNLNILSFLIISSLVVKPKTINMNSLSKYNKWTLKIDDNELFEISDYLKQKEDFKLILIRKNDCKQFYLTQDYINPNECFKYDNYFNLISEKSQYLGDYAHFYFSKTLSLEHLRRHKIISDISNYYFNQHGSCLVENKYKSENLLIIFHSDDLQHNRENLIPLSKSYYALPLGILKNHLFE